MSKCCIIGGAGFIGSHLVALLRAQGMEISVLDRKPAPERALPNGVQYVQGDLGHQGQLKKALEGATEIVDLAYSTVPKTSYEDPVKDILSNLPAAVRMLEAASKLEVRKVVLVSSGGTVYGRAREIPISEEHPTNPISPYGITKLALEKYGLMFHQLAGLPVVIVRPGNAYGEGQRPFTGQGFVATAMGSILRHKEIVLFGEQGTIRDYVYVGDVARGIAAGLEHGIPGSVYNIGSGIGRSNREILEVIEALARPAGYRLRIRIAPPRPFDVPINVLDCRKLHRAAGWQPRVPLEEGIQRTWNWFQLQRGFIEE